MSTVRTPPQTETNQSESSDTFKIIVLDNIATAGIVLMESTPGIEYEVRTGLSGERLREALQGFDGAVCIS